VYVDIGMNTVTSATLLRVLLSFEPPIMYTPCMVYTVTLPIRCGRFVYCVFAIYGCLFGVRICELPCVDTPSSRMLSALHHFMNVMNVRHIVACFDGDIAVVVCVNSTLYAYLRT
jgi:hypothetical protein